MGEVLGVGYVSSCWGDARSGLSWFETGRGVGGGLLEVG